MKRIFYLPLFVAVLGFASCVKFEENKPVNTPDDDVATRAAGDIDGQIFYYFGIENRKIFLNHVKDKIFIKFAPTATKAQFQSVVNDDLFTRSKVVNLEDHFVEGYSFNMTILEGREMSSQDINSLKAREEIVSVTYLLESNGSQAVYTDEFLVKLKKGNSFTQLQNLADKNNCIIGKEDEFVRDQYYVSVSKTSELDAIQMANLFYETGLFEFAEPSFFLLNAFNSNDQFFPDQWGLKNTTPNEVDINAELAWAITTGNPNIRIAVIDCGVDLTHPDLQGNMLAGYDASGTGTGGGPYYNNQYSGSTLTALGDNHGTAVAGIIAAQQNNNYEGISGVAPNCKIVPIKAGHERLGPNPDWAATSINWIVDNNKADIINCSWGSASYPKASLVNAINKAITNGRGGKGCIIVASSGNDGINSVYYPANLSDVIAVGSVKQTGLRDTYRSNFGSGLDVVAPGVDIYTTDRQYSEGYDPVDGYFPFFSGTSAAAPHVAGIAALMLSVNPSLTAQQVSDIIESTAQKVGGYNYATTSGRPNGTWHQEMGYGLVSAFQAVNRTFNSLSIGGDPRPPLYHNVGYYIPENLPPGVTFSHWDVFPSQWHPSPSDSYEVTNGLNNPTLRIAFADAIQFVVTAYFSLPNGGISTTSKIVNVDGSMWNPVMSGPTTAMMNTTVHFERSHDTGLRATWEVYPTNGSQILWDYPDSYWMDVYFTAPGWYVITATYSLPNNETYSMHKEVAVSGVANNPEILGPDIMKRGIKGMFSIPTQVPAGAVFSRWRTTPDDSYLFGWSHLDETPFELIAYQLGDFILTAEFTLPNNSTYSVSKTITVEETLDILIAGPSTVTVPVNTPVSSVLTAPPPQGWILTWMIWVGNQLVTSTDPEFIYTFTTPGTYYLTASIVLPHISGQWNEVTFNLDKTIVVQ